MKTLTPEIYDKMTAHIRNPSKRGSLASDCLWGAKTIASYLGLTEDVVRTLADREDCPIRKPSGKYFVTIKELHNWLDLNTGI
ncbi:hypothetical protein F9K97_02245 [Brucella anthropi]|uniref:hypothetical protein n=1 Tax=Brucella anthropi TaxID=529 RepID=UPI00124CD3A3|nr:hypothetical protein [Brucella anthropi]KAB2780499.1 hypothetical protein F9L00_07925 [Brucella anthropi]KAB2789381.1 hypothetical protein F9K97_02245 [Brucella anthropi]